MAVADWLIVVACLGDGRHDITDLALPKGFEHGFHIHDWGSIDYLEVSHLHAEILGGKNFDYVNPERVGTIRERVTNTPCTVLLASSRGCTWRMPLSAK